MLNIFYNYKSLLTTNETKFWLPQLTEVETFSYTCIFLTNLQIINITFFLHRSYVLLIVTM